MERYEYAVGTMFTNFKFLAKEQRKDTTPLTDSDVRQKFTAGPRGWLFGNVGFSQYFS